jgi:hypothetical protein
MPARLVQIQEERAGRVIPLGGGELIIGRDAAAHVVFDHPRVSRMHLRVSPDGGRYLLTDLDSSNGTTVNGMPVSGSRPLETGDRIELGQAIALRYEESTRAVVPLLLGAIAVFAVLLVGLTFVLLRSWSDPLMIEAAQTAQEGIDAYEQRDWQAAQRQLSAAVGKLYDGGRLDDVPRLTRPEEGLRRIAGQLPGQPDLVAMYGRASELSREERSKRVEPEPEQQLPAGDCRLDQLVERAALDACVRARTEAVLLAVWQHPGAVPESFFEMVEVQLRVLVLRKDLPAMLRRGQQLGAMMEQELAAEHMPTILRYLALIESGNRAEAVSSAGAVGLWQFMPATARDYKLQVGAGRDERTDPRKSTRAAARYLNALAFEFGGDALLLAIAAYNKGENGVRAALRKGRDPRTERTYFRLVERKLLPSETESYVPRFVAAAILGEAGVPAAEGFPTATR